VFGASPSTNAVVLGLLAVLVFVPIGYVYPTRQRFLRPLTISLGIAWGVVLLLTVARLPQRPPTLLYASLVFPIYYFALSLYLHFRRRTS
jgi:phosphatidylcholine synthase